MEITPELIILAFDDCIAYIYGNDDRREYQHRDDDKVARSWIEKGATLTICMAVFCKQLEWMAENGRERPTCLSVFDENIESAIHRIRGDYLEPWELNLSRWKARVLCWKKNPSSWKENMFGPPPDSPDTQTPKSVLVDTGVSK